MSANLAEVTISGSTFPNILALPKQQTIGSTTIQTAIRESHTDKLTVTDHPVEQGADVTDHSYTQPPRVTLECGWSNSSAGAIVSIVSGLFSGGTMSASDYVSGIYSQLLKTYQARKTINVSTGLRQYTNMLIEEINVSRDKVTGNALMCTVSLRQMNFVSPQTSSVLPPQASQGTPSSTAGVQTIGEQYASPATPAPGGSAPATDWIGAGV